MSPEEFDDQRQEDREALDIDENGDAARGEGSEISEEGALEVPSDGASESEGLETAVEEVDQRIIDLLSWILDTETRAKIYIHLLASPGSTSEEVAKGTGLYPSTVREALAELHEEDRVRREKRKSEGAGNNPYEYTAIKPSELVGGVVDQVQQELNTIVRLDRILSRGEEPELDEDVEPVTITVDDGGVTVLDEDDEETASITAPEGDGGDGDQGETAPADESGAEER